jgi:DNA-binding NarL/FixJ family response regulator
MNSLLHALLAWGPALLLAAGIPLGAYLYLALQVELRLLARRAVTRAEVDSRYGELAAELATLRVRLAAAESRATATPTESASQAVNLNRRGQVLRLHGKGRTAAEIAADLQISQGEVELLVKVHEWPAASVL